VVIGPTAERIHHSGLYAIMNFRLQMPSLESPLLEEVPPSPGNCSPPREAVENWDALDCGGFRLCTEEGARKDTMKTLSLTEQRHANIVRNNKRLAELGLSNSACEKASARKHRRMPRYKARTTSIRPPMRRAEVIPAKKMRTETHPLLWKRIYVIWNEVEKYFGEVTKFDSDRINGSPFFIKYEDGDEQWEREADLMFES
jgi:hypothetical protein